MALARELDEKYIIEKLAQIESMVRLSNNQQLYDIDHVLEDFCTGLINLVYGLNLHNINNEKKNSPAIDLGDPEAKIAVQITSDKSGTKIRQTVEKFIENNLYNTYDKLLIVLLVPKQDSYSVPINTEGHLSFSKSNDIIDFGDIVNSIKSQGLELMQRVREFIEKEFPDDYPPINTSFFDRVKEILKKLDDGEEREVGLEIEFFFDQNVQDKYEELIHLLDMQAERQEILAFYEDQLRSILAEEGKSDEYDWLLAQAEQYDYYEPLYDFCAGYRFITRIPYDFKQTEVIDFRKEHETLLRRSAQIREARNQCIAAVKAASKKMVRQRP